MYPTQRNAKYEVIASSRQDAHSFLYARHNLDQLVTTKGR